MSDSLPEPSLTRRRFLEGAATLGAATLVSSTDAVEPRVMTVNGPLPAKAMGLTLTHEHVLCDFIGAEKVSPDRYDPNEAYSVMLPFLNAARKRGVKTFVDCTPMYIGRDVKLLKRLADATGLQILTNTGLYKEPFLPKYAFEETPEQLADRWVKEFNDGIDGTKIKPGFIKIAVNPGQLLDVQKKILRAASLASRRTGLTVGCHTGHGEAALESLALLKEWSFPLSKYIVIHADAIADRAVHDRIAEAGAWLSYDGIGGRPVKEHVEMIVARLQNAHISRVLLSHDAGWYQVGEPNGGKPRGFTALTDDLIPALRAAGVNAAEIERLTVQNPQRAFALGRG